MTDPAKDVAPEATMFKMTLPGGSTTIDQTHFWRTARRTWGWGHAVCVVAVLSCIADVIAGIALIAQTEGGYLVTRPYASIGSAVIAAGIVSGIILFCLGTYVKMRAYAVLISEQRRLQA